MKLKRFCHCFTAIIVLLVITLAVSGCGKGNRGNPISSISGGGVSAPGTGNIAGSVLDVEGSAVEGATISIRGTSLNTVTDSLGNFELTGVPSGLQEVFVDGRTAANGRYTSIVQEVFVVGGGLITVDLLQGLVRVATESEVSIGSGGGTVENPDLPGVIFDVPAGAVSNIHQFSITLIPTTNLPFPLPDGYQPVFAYWIEPEGEILNIPALLSVTNDYGIAPNETLSLFSTRVEDSGWTASGELTVSADGSVIETTSGGITHLPYVVGALLPHVIEGQVLTFADSVPVVNVTVSAEGEFIASSISSVATDQNGHFELILVGAAPGAGVTLSIAHPDFVIAVDYRTGDLFDLNTWGETVIIEPVDVEGEIKRQTVNLFVTSVFLSAKELALGDDRNNITVLTNEPDRDISRINLRPVSQIDVDDLLSREGEVNLVRGESVSSLEPGWAILQNDFVLTSKRSRTLLELSGNQGFIAVDSISDLRFDTLENVLSPRSRTVFATTSNGRFYVDFTPVINGVVTDSTLTLTSAIAIVEATDAEFTFTQVESEDVTQAILEVWRGTVLFTDRIRDKDNPIEVAEGETEKFEISAGDLPLLAPSNLRAEESLRQVTLTWDPSIEPNIVGYKVYRREVGEADFELITPEPLEPSGGASEAYTDFRIPVGGIEYSYQVTAVNFLLNESVPSQVAGAIPAPIDLQASSDQAARAVNLSWDDNPLDNAVTGYNMYRATDFEGTYSLINAEPILPTVDHLGNAYLDEDFVVVGEEYFYYVTVLHGSEWEGGRSTIISASPSAINLSVDEPPLIRQVHLDWADPLAEGNPDLLGYNVYRKRPADALFTEKINDDPIPWAAAMQFDDFDFPLLEEDVDGNPITTYQYTVRPVIVGGAELIPSDIASQIPIPIQMEIKNLDKAVEVSWTDTANDPDNIGYHVWRSKGTPGQVFFPDDFTRLNQIPVPVKPDTDGDGVESYGYQDNTVKNFDYVYVVTPVHEIAGDQSDLTPSPEIIGEPAFELVPNFHANGLEFITPDVGFIWGRDGIVIKTIDGGISFEALPLFNAQELADLTEDELFCKDGDFVNANVGYLLYDRDTGTSFIKRTNSGGDSWETVEAGGQVIIETGTSLDPSHEGTYQVGRLSSIQFISSAEGYAASAEIPSILASGNGGITWYEKGKFQQVTVKNFTLSGTITASGSGTVLIDSLADFIAAKVAPELNVENVTDGSTATVLSVEDANTLTTTPLSGGSNNTYEVGDTYLVSGDAKYEIRPDSPASVSFFDSNNGVAFALGVIERDPITDEITNIIPPQLWHYSSNEWKWRNNTRMADSIEGDDDPYDTLVPLKVSILTGSSAIAFSYTGEQLLGFNSFFMSPQLQNGYFELGFGFDFFPSDVAFNSTTEGWAIGNGFQNGYILHTTISGNLWEAQLIKPTLFEREFSQLSVVDNKTIFAVSIDKLYRTFDGGVTWEELDIEIYN